MANPLLAVSPKVLWLPRWLSGKNIHLQMQKTQEMQVLIPGLGISAGEGNGNPLQYSCVENPMDRGAWQATVHRAAKSWIQLEQLSMAQHST